MEQDGSRRLTFAIRIALLLGMPICFALGTSGFVTAANAYAIMQSFAFIGLLALGISLTMIAGEFDLSTVAMATVGGLITIKLCDQTGSVSLAIVCAVGVGLLVGLANAALLPWLQISSLVTTVGMMMLLTGIAYWLAGGRTLTYENFDVSDFLDQNLAWVLSPRSLVTIIAYILVATFLAFARIGRDIYAAGGHRIAAIQSGARVGPALLICFVFSGGFAALAGALMSLSLATASATMNGANVLPQAVAAAIIGGVALEGGVGTPFGVAGGVLILTILNNGLSLMNASSAQILLINGCLLLVIVLLDGRIGAHFVSLIPGRTAANRQ
jgi:ribose/xylose/arabinose/galactoside ABC-type transport system permease subunit